MTVTSRHTDRKTKKDRRECRWTSGGGSKSRSQVERLKHLGARLGTADFLFQGRERRVLLKIPRCDIDGVGEGK